MNKSENFSYLQTNPRWEFFFLKDPDQMITLLTGQSSTLNIHLFAIIEIQGHIPRSKSWENQKKEQGNLVPFSSAILFVLLKLDYLP